MAGCSARRKESRMTTMQLTDEATGHFIDAAGIRTHYNEMGSGPAVVCLHGGGPGASGFSNFKQNIEVLSKSYRTLLLDQPGFGQTAIPPASLNSADHLKGFLDAIGEKKASLIGNSMG